MFNFLLKKDIKQPEIHAIFFCLLPEECKWKMFQEGLQKVTLEPSKQMIRVFGLVMSWGKKVSTAVLCLHGILWLGSVQSRVSISQ